MAVEDGCRVHDCCLLKQSGACHSRGASLRRHTHRYVDANADSHANINPHTNGHAHTNADSHAHTDALADPNAIAHLDPLADGHEAQNHKGTKHTHRNSYTKTGNSGPFPGST